MTAVARELNKWDRARSVRHPDSRIQQAAEIHQVALRLAREFELVLPLDMVSTVVTRAVRDFTGEVPAKSLPEFVHHAARQRLIDASGVDPHVHGASAPTDARSRSMTAVIPGPTLDGVIKAAFALGSATRTDLLTAAVTAQAPTGAIEDLLRLPERRYHSPSEVLALLG